MPQLSTFTRRLRAFLGLPHDNGHFTCHPENLKKGERLKVPGVVKRDAQDRSYVDWSESAWQEVDPWTVVEAEIEDEQWILREMSPQGVTWVRPW